MAIYNPEIFLSKEDRELLYLLASLLLGYEDGEPIGNRVLGEIPLSYQESARLLDLLEQFVSSRKFRDGSYFIEKFFGAADREEKQLREIYLAWRRRYGKSRSAASVQWENFVRRIGIWPIDRHRPDVWYRPSAEPMDINHFLAMERRLAQSTGVSSRVQALILKFLMVRIVALGKMRRGELTLEDGQVRELPLSLLTKLQQQHTSPTGTAPISTTKLTGILTIVMDFSVLFTTRDWSVAGLLSATAGALPQAFLD